MKTKKISAGNYSAKYKGWEIRIYRCDNNKFWSSECKKGDRVEYIQADYDPNKKSELVECIVEFIDAQ